MFAQLVTVTMTYLARRNTLSMAACCLLLAGMPAWAATYYVNASTLSSTNPGTSAAKPWKTLSKVNSTATSGDIVYLAKGSSWHETLVVKSGVTYASYNNGTATAKPLINGAKPLGALSTWALSKGTVYKTTLKNITTTGVGELYLYSSAGVVTRLQRARHPNVGQGAWGAGSRYARIGDSGQVATIDSLPMEEGALPNNSTTQVTSASLAGADAYIRINNYEFVKYRITGGVGNVLKTKRRSLDPMLPDVDSIPGDIIDQKDPAVTYNNLRITPGWGYWLENQAWMLDSPGEWYHDAATNTLYVQMPNGKTPKGQTLAATVLTTGITGTAAGNVVIRNIEVRDTRGDGIAIEGLTTNGIIEQVDVNRPGGKGISVTNSTGGSINNVAVRDSIMQGVWMGDHRYPGTKASSNVHLTNSLVSQAGRGYYAHSAVMLGNGSKAIGNTVEGSSAFGIHGWRNNQIENNFVNNTCMEFDDCGGIYVISKGESGLSYGYALQSTIKKNVVSNLPGNADGRLDNGSSTKGIYLDDFSQFVEVTDNFTTNADVGYMLHFARNVTLSGNKSSENRYAALWLQENGMGKDADGNDRVFECGSRPDCNASNYLQHNTINNNTFASADGRPAVILTSEYESTSDFATFNNNRYVTTDSVHLVEDEILGQPTVAHDTLATWQAQGKDAGSSYYRAVAGFQRPASAPSQLIRNGDFGTNNLGNWYAYNCTATFATLTPGIPSLQAFGTADLGSNGRKLFILHTLDPLPVVSNKLYLAAFEARSSVANDSGLLAIRRNGPTYDNLSTTGSFTLQPTTKAFYRVLESQAAAQGATSRLDLEFTADGVVVLDGVRLYEVNKVSSINSAFTMFNTSSADSTRYCPSQDNALCSRFVDASTGLAIRFPFVLPAKSALIGTLSDSPWLDDDGDTVPNSLDDCANSDFATYGSYGNGCQPDR